MVRGGWFMVATLTVLRLMVAGGAGAGGLNLLNVMAAPEGGGGSQEEPPRTAALPFLIIGHRGAPAVECENTLESFAKALDLGANALELDLCMTRDRHVVVWHDSNNSSGTAMARMLHAESGTTYRPWLPNLFSKYRTDIHELDLKDFRREFGYTTSGTRPLGDAEKSPHRIPTLPDFLAWAKGQPRLLRFFLDVKVSADNESRAAHFAVQAVADLVAAGMDDRAIFMSTSAPMLRMLTLAKESSRVAFTYDQEIPLISDGPEAYSSVREGARLGCTWSSAGRPVFDTEDGCASFLRKMAELELGRLAPLGVEDRPSRFVAWTVDDEDEMRSLIRLGVHGIITNYPDRLAAVVREVERKES